MRTILILLLICTPCYALDVASHLVVEPTFDQQMATYIVDENSYLIVNLASVTTQIAGSGQLSEPRSAGFFTGGNTPIGTLLPAQNRNADFPDAAYSGGIGFDTGIVLGTGLVDDQTPEGEPALTQALGVGAEGPNNGLGIDPENEGEASKIMDREVDSDFVNEIGTSAGGDASVLQFTVTMTNPGYIRLTFIHASDEVPFWSLQRFNDTPMTFFDGKNAIKFRETDGGVTVDKLLSLADLETCGFLKKNDVAPAPIGFTRHRNGTNIWYDHEYGGFTKPISKESQLLNVGTHTIKIVTQDVTDRVVDSALFIAKDAVKVYPFAPGDYNLDGVVDSADYVIWRKNEGITSGATVTQGDGDGNGMVDKTDYKVWREHYGLHGNGDFTADFNRDGIVDGGDYVIWRKNSGLLHCAGRFEGDADADGDVDNDDYNIWRSQYGLGQPTAPAAARTALAAADAPAEGWPTEAEMGITDKIKAKAAKALDTTNELLFDVVLPETADADGDGDFDKDDLKILDELIL
jgi:hypothetical protein